MTETLTKEEREALSRCARCVRDAVPRDEIGKALRIIDAHAADRAALVVQLEAANGLLARAQDGSPKRPREACSDQVQLDYDIGQHLQRHGWKWDAINRKWRRPALEHTETASWTEFRGREM